MDKQQTKTPAAMDGLERAGIIIRNIQQIEADGELAIGALSERMMRAAVQAITKVAVSPWQVIEVDWTARIVCPEWKMVRGVGTGDAWLELTDIGPEDEEGFSWIGVAVGVAPTKFGLELVFRPGLQAIAETVIQGDKAIAPLLKLGMERDDAVNRLFFPITIQAEMLAQGFEQNDLDNALLPVGKTTEKAVTAKAELDRLVGLVRAAATAK